MSDVKTADAGRRCHGQTVGQGHAYVRTLQHLKHAAFDAVVRASRVAGRGAYALVFFFDQLFVA